MFRIARLLGQFSETARRPTLVVTGRDYPSDKPGAEYARQGRGFSLPGLIALPTKAFTRCRPFFIYYLAHELAHLSHGGLNHGTQLCRVEQVLLMEFQLGINYWGGSKDPTGWYPAGLYCQRTGDALCDGQGRPVRPEWRLPL